MGATSPTPRRRFDNPVYPEYFADPFVWRTDECYCAIGTGAAEAAGATRSSREPTVFPLLRSDDLQSWRPAGHALVRPDAALGNAFWAPEVACCDDTWYLYYSVGHDDRAHQLRVAVAETPTGPYVDSGALTTVDEVPFAIDPHPFRDDDGQWYLFHARDFLDTIDEHGAPVRAGTALVVSPMASMLSLTGEVRTVARARCDWQRFAADRPMYDARYDWHTLEGPFVVRHDDRYYCLYSGGCWQDHSYGVDYAFATSALGPWRDDASNEGPRVLRTAPGRLLGPGHCSVFTGHDGVTRYLAYHAWDAAMTARRLCIEELVFTSAGPRVAGAASARGITADSIPE
ncbi:MAG TPA: glycoside hydrolase family 43 protein [Steroidobacteraceae bacterium]|nr:glycoside hydrolase family 43 protein [Steroidobacteraceae bacterium]